MKIPNPKAFQTWSRPSARPLTGVAVLLLATTAAQAQLDPTPRQLLQLGASSSLHNQGPYGAYAFYYWNMPNELATNQVMRFAIAPCYVDGDYGFKGLLGPQTDLAIGAFGGLYANDYQEVDGGNWKKDESFNGNGGGGRISLYHRVNPDQKIPLTLVARESMNFEAFDRTSETSKGFGPAEQPGSLDHPRGFPLGRQRTGARSEAGHGSIRLVGVGSPDGKWCLWLQRRS